MKIEFFTIDELNYFKEHCDFTEDELYLLDEKSKGKTLEETGFDIDTLKSVKRKIRKALEDREMKTMTEVTVDTREVLENIRVILEDHVEDDHSLEIFNRVIDYAKKRIDDYGLLKTELEILKNKDNKEVKWIRDTSHGMVRYQCAKCKGFKTLAYDYCPDCGAKMDVIKTTTKRMEKKK